MNWNEKEIRLLKELYPKNIPLSKISKKIGRSVRAIQRKATREGISRPRFPSNKPSKRQPKKIIDRRYYEKHRKKVYERKMKRRKRLKEEALKMLGGKCKICGYNKCRAAMEFHHPKGTKEGGIHSFLKNESRQKLLKEAKKCILLCANCHREVHNRVSG